MKILIQPFDRQRWELTGKVHYSYWEGTLFTGVPLKTKCGHELKRAVVWAGEEAVTCLKCLKKMEGK